MKAAIVFQLAALASLLMLPGATSASQAEHRPIFAYYYAWYDVGSYAGYIQQPLTDKASDDPSELAWAIEQAKAGGIDAFVVDWLGSGDRTDQAVQLLMDQGFPASILFETDFFCGVDDVVAQLQAYYANRLGNPKAATLSGKPIIFFWRANTYDEATWDAIRAQVDPERRANWVADGDDAGILAGGAWDGWSPYAIAWSGDPGGQNRRWGSQAAGYGKLWVPPVSPGCDDSHAHATTCYQPRSANYYRGAIDGALASNPSGIMVSTFNEWAEDTQVAFSQQDADRYLGLTHDAALVLNP